MSAFIGLVGEKTPFRKTQGKFGISFNIDLLIHI